MIAALVPVLNRPWRAMELARNFYETSSEDSHLVFVCSVYDTVQIEHCRATGADVIVLDVAPGAGDYARKINLGYRKCHVDWLLLGADDLQFHPGWDIEALRVAEETGVGVIGTNDLGNPTVKAGKHSTHPLVRRSYIDEQGGTLDREPGVVLCELYGHQNCDTELITLAKARKTWAFASDSHVEHLHPFWKKGEMDDVYRKGQETSKADSRLYNQRLRMLRKVDP